MTQNTGKSVASSNGKLADAIIRVVEINRASLNGLLFGKVVFDVARGELVGISASTDLRLSANAHLCPLTLRGDAPPDFG